jgi:hypothetical protein
MEMLLIKELRRLQLIINIFEIWIFFFWIACGIGAYMLAVSKNRSGKGWGGMALLFGPPVFFVLGFLPMRDAGVDEFFSLFDPSPKMRKCPHCAETIKAEARACKHCGRDVFEASSQKQNAESAKTERQQERPTPKARYCHACGASAPLDATSCPACLRDLPAKCIFCPECAHDISFKPDVCPGCGAGLRWRKAEGGA